MDFLSLFSALEKVDGTFLIDGDNAYSYQQFYSAVSLFRNEISSIGSFETVLLNGRPSFKLLCQFTALALNKNIIIPFDGKIDHELLLKAKVRWEIKNGRVEPLNYQNEDPLYQELKALDSPGIVLFSSGTSTNPKGVVHNLNNLIRERKLTKQKILLFLNWDHIGGLNTILYSILTQSCLVIPKTRTLSHIIEIINKHKVDILPTSPTFLKLLLFHNFEAPTKLPSLKKISYGSEPMPEHILKSLSLKYPHIQFIQTYGLSETGIIKIRSKSRDSNLIKIFEDYMVKDGILYLKSPSHMLGVLGEKKDSSGWYKTNDLVEKHGEWIKVLGRDSDIINVGGLKVKPQEVEEKISAIDNVKSVLVRKKKNPLLGEIVCAHIVLNSQETLSSFKKRMHLTLSKQLDSYKIPQEVILENEIPLTKRFKLDRSLV
ncbi:MAG: fatty acid--CoA ligase family protein [Bdellovibrionales bacterium]|nr:fatty acid--CoA ligase family protein [Bdellovibrionales bacterium]